MLTFCVVLLSLWMSGSALLRGDEGSRPALRRHRHGVHPSALWAAAPSRAGLDAVAARADLAKFVEEGRSESTNRYWQTPLLMPQQEKPICMQVRGNESYAVPRIYLLGQKKCGTTSAAFDMKLAGMQGAFKSDPWKKELHTFDDMCNWKVAKQWGEAEWTGQTKPSSCPGNPEPQQRESWLLGNPWYSCNETTRGVFADLSPVNMRLVGLPEMMGQLYGPDADRLAFGVLLREPLARFQSDFYFSRNGSDWAKASPDMETFGTYIASIRDKVDAYAAEGMTGIDLDYELDEFYRSLYWRNLLPWFSRFSPKQFVIIPMKYYFESQETKLNTLELMGKQFDAYVVPDLAVNKHEFNQGVHPHVEKDLDEEARAWLTEEHFTPDTVKLSQMFADFLPGGLSIAGYRGEADPSEIRSYLEAHW